MTSYNFEPISVDTPGVDASNIDAQAEQATLSDILSRQAASHADGTCGMSTTLLGLREDIMIAGDNLLQVVQGPDRAEQLIPLTQSQINALYDSFEFDLPSTGTGTLGDLKTKLTSETQPLDDFIKNKIRKGYDEINRRIEEKLTDPNLSVLEQQKMISGFGLEAGDGKPATIWDATTKNLIRTKLTSNTRHLNEYELSLYLNARGYRANHRLSIQAENKNPLDANALMQEYNNFKQSDGKYRAELFFINHKNTHWERLARSAASAKANNDAMSSRPWNNRFNQWLNNETPNAGLAAGLGGFNQLFNSLGLGGLSGGAANSTGVPSAPDPFVSLKPIIASLPPPLNQIFGLTIGVFQSMLPEKPIEPDAINSEYAFAVHRAVKMLTGKDVKKYNEAMRGFAQCAGDSTKETQFIAALGKKLKNRGYDQHRDILVQDCFTSMMNDFEDFRCLPGVAKLEQDYKEELTKLLEEDSESRLKTTQKALREADLVCQQKQRVLDTCQEVLASNHGLDTAGVQSLGQSLIKAKEELATAERNANIAHRKFVAEYDKAVTKAEKTYQTEFKKIIDGSNQNNPGQNQAVLNFAKNKLGINDPELLASLYPKLRAQERFLNRPQNMRLHPDPDSVFRDDSGAKRSVELTALMDVMRTCKPFSAADLSSDPAERRKQLAKKLKDAQTALSQVSEDTPEALSEAQGTRDAAQQDWNAFLALPQTDLLHAYEKHQRFHALFPERPMADVPEPEFRESRRGSMLDRSLGEFLEGDSGDEVFNFSDLEEQLRENGIDVSGVRDRVRRESHQNGSEGDESASPSSPGSPSSPRSPRTSSLAS